MIRRASRRSGLGRRYNNTCAKWICTGESRDGLGIGWGKVVTAVHEVAV